eukprot:3630220-Alexandrium_andersonii.AAC.1
MTSESRPLRVWGWHQDATKADVGKTDPAAEADAAVGETLEPAAETVGETEPVADTVVETEPVAEMVAEDNGKDLFPPTPTGEAKPADDARQPKTPTLLKGRRSLMLD